MGLNGGSGAGKLMAGPMRGARRRGFAMFGRQDRFWRLRRARTRMSAATTMAFVSAWFDEAPTGKVFGVSSGYSWRTRRWRRTADVLRSCESLDDKHRCAAVSANEGGPHGAGCGMACA